MPITYQKITLPQPNPRTSPFYLCRLFGYKGDEDGLRIHPGIHPNGAPAVWEIESIAVKLVTSAAVANRNITIGILRTGMEYAGESNYVLDAKGAAVAASTTARMVAGPVSTGLPLSASVTTVNTIVDYVTINRPIIFAWDYAQIFINNSQAGDTFDIQVMAKYLNYELGIIEAS